MVAHSGKSLPAQPFAHLLDRAARQTVHDHALSLLLPQKRDKGGIFVRRLFHLKTKVGTIKAGTHGHRLPQIQQLHNIAPHLSCGCGGKRSHRRPLRKRFQKLPDLQIAGTKILSPLGYAVRFIHRNKGDRQSFRHTGKAFRQKTLRSHINDFIPALRGALKRQTKLPRGQGAVQVSRLHAGLDQSGNLILHQGNQRRNHKRYTVHHQRRDLIAKRFSRSRRHQPEHIAPRQKAVHQLLLPASKRRISKIFPKNLPFVLYQSIHLLHFACIV